MYMKTISDIRRENLDALARQLGSVDAVAAASSTSPVYLSQIKNQALDSKTGKPRQMGSALARKLEVGCNKPSGWMDTDHQSPPNVEISSTEISLGKTLARLGQALERAKPQTRAAVADLLSRYAQDPAQGKSLAQAIEMLVQSDIDKKADA